MNGLEYHRFQGSHREIGRQYGTACASEIARHLGLVYERLERAGVSRSDATSRALTYRPFVVDHAPTLDDEIVGLAEGAQLELGEAYLLQLRAEVLADAVRGPIGADECTTFAVLPVASADGSAYAGQNADLPPMYQDLMLVLHLVPDEGPEILMVTPAGQISYIGISSDGMASFGNFLECDGWRTGFPRYLLSRFALAQRSVEAAIVALRALPRGSSRNLMLLDQGGAVDFENTPTRDALLAPAHGVMGHANHYLAPSLHGEERARWDYLANSRIRQARIDTLLDDHRGELTAPVLASIMRDRTDAPDPLSVERQDVDGRDEASDRSITVTAVIAEPAIGRIWVSAGPPSTTPYVAYDFASGRTDETL